MLSKAEKYQQIIHKATRRQILFPETECKEKIPYIKFQSDLVLPSTYPFRSSQQIQNNILTIVPVTHLKLVQSIHNVPTLLQHIWPKSCIGLIICQHHQNNKIYYVYGTGVLIHGNIVLASAQNVYCRRLHTEYIHIKFITGVVGDKCSGIYDVMRVHYPKEYTMEERYENYSFAILQLYDDLSDSCGYVGWKKNGNKFDRKEDVSIYAYKSDSKQGYFNLRQFTKQLKLKQIQEGCSNYGEFLENQYYIMGLYTQQNGRYIILSQIMKNMINQWTKRIILEMNYQDLGELYIQITKYAASDLRQLILYCDQIDGQGCKYLSQANWIQLTNIDLQKNKIGAQGCKYLSKVNWVHITVINLQNNNIGQYGCKYLSQTNWTHLNNINLQGNNIGEQGCKYLSEANWAHLTNINLTYNKINAYGCRHLSQANWDYLANINLRNNNIGAQGCKLLSEANWKHLINIDITNNNIGDQGCKYLSQTNWTHLTKINLANLTILFQNINISDQGCKYLRQAYWPQLNNINLHDNNIGEQGCKYLSGANWTHLTNISLRRNNIKNAIHTIVLKELWQKIQMQF